MPVNDIATADTARHPRPLWDRVRAHWQTLLLIGAIAGAGAVGAAKLDAYATKDDLRPLNARVTALEASASVTAALLVEIKQSTAAAREDIRALLQHMLAHPPRGDR